MLLFRPSQELEAVQCVTCPKTQTLAWSRVAEEVGDTGGPGRHSFSFQGICRALRAAFVVIPLGTTC